MKLIVDERAKKFLDKLDKKSSSKVLVYIKIFESYGFNLPTNYLKKIKHEIWELRPGRLRIFLYIKADNAVAVHAIFKKTQKISNQDWETINQRISDRLRLESK